MAGFNKQKNLFIRLVLDSLKISKPVHLKIHVETLNRFSHKICPDGQSRSLFCQVCVLAQPPVQEKQVKCTFQGEGSEQGVSDCFGPAQASSSHHILLMTSSNSGIKKDF